MTSIINLNEDNFDNEVMNSEVPCVVDFGLNGVARVSPLVLF